MRARSSGLTLLTVAAAVGATACELAFPTSSYRADPLDAEGSESGGDSSVVGDGGDGGNEGGVDVAPDGGETITDDCGTYAVGKMVTISGYCIDTTEVTHAQYNQFLTAAVPPQSTTGDPVVCNWNTDYGTAVSGRDDYPVVNVDWCDAYAFCLWAGKRLCGSTEGGSVDPSNAATSLSQWYVACANGDANTTWPYGNTFSNTICNGDPDHVLTNAPSKVGSYAQCHGLSPPYDAVFDMSGNVQEWEDGCYQSHGASDGCSLRGGDWGSNPDTDMSCAHDQTEPRNTVHETVGFRCCK